MQFSSTPAFVGAQDCGPLKHCPAGTPIAMHGQVARWGCTWSAVTFLQSVIGASPCIEPPADRGILNTPQQTHQTKSFLCLALQAWAGDRSFTLLHREARFWGVERSRLTPCLPATIIRFCNNLCSRTWHAIFSVRFCSCHAQTASIVGRTFLVLQRGMKQQCPFSRVWSAPTNTIGSFFCSSAQMINTCVPTEKSTLGSNEFQALSRHFKNR